MTATPEHDKIDELRTVNPLATNLLHLLLSVPGWVIVNDIAEPPVRIPVSRIAAALLGVDAAAYRAESEARFGLDDVPSEIADLVLDWSKEDAVIDELRELAILAGQRATDVFDVAVAESPIAAAAGRDRDDLVSESTTFATPDPVVPDHLRGTVAGAAVAAGLLDAGDAAAHPAAALPFTGVPSATATPAAAVPFTVPAPQRPVGPLPTGLYAPGSAPLVPEVLDPFAPPAPLIGAGAPVLPSPLDAIIAPLPTDGVPTPLPTDGAPAPFPTDGAPSPLPGDGVAFQFDLPPADQALLDFGRHYNVVESAEPHAADGEGPFEAASWPNPEVVLDPAYPDDEFDGDDWVEPTGDHPTPAPPAVNGSDDFFNLPGPATPVDPFDIPYGGAPAIVEGSGDLADANDDDDEQLIYPGYEPKDAPLA